MNIAKLLKHFKVSSNARRTCPFNGGSKSRNLNRRLAEYPSHPVDFFRDSIKTPKEYPQSPAYFCRDGQKFRSRPEIGYDRLIPYLRACRLTRQTSDCSKLQATVRRASGPRQITESRAQSEVE